MLSRFMPPGTIHVVFTVCRSKENPECAIVEGGFFDPFGVYVMVAILYATIQSAVWNYQWSNTNLEFLRNLHTLYYLEHHQSLLPRTHLFSGRQLYALLYLGMFSNNLFPRNEDNQGALNQQSQEKNDLVVSILSTISSSLVSNLSEEDHAEFFHFCDEFNGFFVKDYALSLGVADL